MKISVAKLSDLILVALRKKYDQKDAQLIADILLFGELSGKTTHGIVRLLAGNSSVLTQKPKGKPIIQKKSKVSTIIDANGNPGMLVGQYALNEVIGLGKENDFGIVGTNRSFSSSGCLSYFLEKIANQNLICIIMAQSPPSTAPYGGMEPLFGTNPIGFGIPANPKPLIFDMATSAISFGAILKAATLGQKLPKNVVLDSEGNPTTDPKKAMDGATLPFDNSYKGAGLAMMVEILAGILPGADFAGQNPDGGWGNLFIALSPTLLGDMKRFKQNVARLVERVKTSKTKDRRFVRIPGENTFDTRDSNLKKGEIEIEDKLFEELQKAAKLK